MSGKHERGQITDAIAGRQQALEQTRLQAEADERATREPDAVAEANRKAQAAIDKAQQ